MKIDLKRFKFESFGYKRNAKSYFFCMDLHNEKKNRVFPGKNWEKLALIGIWSQYRPAIFLIAISHNRHIFLSPFHIKSNKDTSRLREIATGKVSDLFRSWNSCQMENRIFIGGISSGRSSSSPKLPSPSHLSIPKQCLRKIDLADEFRRVEQSKPPSRLRLNLFEIFAVDLRPLPRNGANLQRLAACFYRENVLGQSIKLVEVAHTVARHAW